jgi:hypothetical protein
VLICLGSPSGFRRKSKKAALQVFAMLPLTLRFERSLKMSSKKSPEIGDAIKKLKKLVPRVKGRRRVEIVRVIQALEEEEAKATKRNPNWTYVARLMLFAAEVVRFFSDEL